MSELLRISVHFLNREFHGRCDNGELEWPPSPLRLFQALTNAAARMSGEGISPQSATALRWLEEMQQPTEILSSKATATTGYQLYVPNNVGDLPKALKEGIASFRTEKRVRPLHLSGRAAVHYFWTLNTSAAADFTQHRKTLIAISRAVTHLGWGVDLVVADAVIEHVNDGDAPYTDTNSERWIHIETSGGSSLRVPAPGTLAALEDHHAAFLNRLQTTAEDTPLFRPVPPLTNFRVVTYRRDTELTQPPYAIFALREADDSKFATFDPQWRRLHLAGMLRHACSQPDFAAALGWDDKKVDSFVLGHDKNDPNNTKPTSNASRLIFIPLPSIEWRGEERGHAVGMIRRVLVTVSGHCEASEFRRIIRALEGLELTDEKIKSHPASFLRRQSDNDGAIIGYFAESAAWTTVTPVVLPGHDDPRKLRYRLRDTATQLSVAEKEQIVRKLDARIERLLRKALIEGGLPATLVADADLQWRDTGFLPGTDLASRYSVPNQCRHFRRLHVRIVWRERRADNSLNPIKLAGPFCFGSGRFAGLGLLAPVD